MARRISLAVLAALALAGAVLVAQDRPPDAAGKKDPLAKLAEPWPDPAVLASRKAEAQNRPLFKDDEPLAFTLTSDFGRINKERSPNNDKVFPGILTIDGRDIPVKLSSRGHLRLKQSTCVFVPLKIDFVRDAIAGTVFEGQTNLKLVTHCQNERDFDQFVMRESLTYRFANLVTPFSFRARLARATYVDAATKKPISTHSALFLENDNDVARRLGGRTVNLPRLQFKDLDMQVLTTTMLLEYMLGNTDYSIWALHNIVIVQDRMRRFYPVAYDFDLSGMVDPPYAVPDSRLDLSSVGDRLYRGPCRTVEQFDAAAEPFRAHKADMLAAVDALKDLNDSHRRKVKDYLESFFRRIETPESIRKTFVDGCHTTRTRV
jgi:hypothetical protein